MDGLSWYEIWHQPAFWLLICVFFLAGASVHACVLHMAALLSDRGITAQGAALGTSVVGLSILIGRVGTGFLLDRFFAPRLATLLFGCASIGIAMLWVGSVGKIAVFAAFLVGLGMGAEVDLIAYCMSRYFGLKSFGVAYGFGFSAFVLAGALGTLLMGAGFDATHRGLRRDTFLHFAARNLLLLHGGRCSDDDAARPLSIRAAPNKTTSPTRDCSRRKSRLIRRLLVGVPRCFVYPAAAPDAQTRRNHSYYPGSGKFAGPTVSKSVGPIRNENRATDSD